MFRNIFHTLGITKETFSSNFTLKFLILLSSLVAITPILSHGKVIILLWGIFIVIAFNNLVHANKQLIQIATLGVAFVFLCAIYRILGISSADFIYCVAYPLLYFAPFLALLVLNKCNNEYQINFLFQIISLAIALNLIDGIWIIHSLGFEGALYQSIKNEVGDAKINLGGSQYVNMIVFYANVMLLALLHTKNKVEKILFLFYFILSASFLIFYSYKASAILLFLLSTALMFISKKGGKSFKTIILLSLFLFGSLIIFKDRLIYFLVDIIGSDRISSRLEVFLTGAAVTDSESFAGREGLWLTSLNTWLTNISTFLFGIGDHNWQEFSSTAESGIGNHSDLLDVLARYGIIGGFLLYSSLVLYYKYLQKQYGELFKWEIMAFFTLIIFMGLMKKFIAVEPPIIIFILLPLCLKHLSQTTIEQ